MSLGEALQRLEDDEIIAAVDMALAEVEAQTLKDMGKVMGLLKQKYTGQMDFGKAGARVKEKLG